ncbi:RT18B protein, partial [Amia calva]|nr:RT18B protein [Amia calva]
SSSAAEADPFDSIARYRERPWEYLESEEYVERYGTQLVWAGYRRNHKGGIPPQKTRKTCIRGDKVCGNPCPICRDPKIIVHHQNVKLLEQFISPHSGSVYDATRTGVCMKQQKNLTKAIETAKDHGLLPFHVPFVDFEGEDYSNTHSAVTHTPPPPFLTAKAEGGENSSSGGQPWYSWYHPTQPDPQELCRVTKLYRKYLKQEVPTSAGQ